MAEFLVAHGAWSAGWAWKKMHPLMREAGHEFRVPTYTGLGERRHLAHPDIGLDTHVEDLAQIVEIEDLRDLVLVGHSYGGIVATALAHRMPNRFCRLIYVDAFVPEDGQCLFDFLPDDVCDEMVAEAKATGDGWRLPSNPIPPDTSEADIAWITPRRMPQPIKAFSTPVRLDGPGPDIPRSYVYCQRIGPGDVFRPFADRARTDAGWSLHEIDASHSPHVTAPEALCDLLVAIVEGAG